MKTLSRRSVATGLAAAVTAIPVLSLPLAPNVTRWSGSSITRELEKAMRDCYGVEVEAITFPKTNGMKPIVAHTC
jgi:hypothetical protein